MPDELDIVALLRESIDTEVPEDFITVPPPERGTILGTVPVHVRGLLVFMMVLKDVNASDVLICAANDLFGGTLKMFLPSMENFDTFYVCEHWTVVGMNLSEEEREAEKLRISTGASLH